MTAEKWLADLRDAWRDPERGGELRQLMRSVAHGPRRKPRPRPWSGIQAQPDGSFAFWSGGRIVATGDLATCQRAQRAQLDT